MITERTTCRLDGSSLESVWNLRDFYVSTFLGPQEQVSEDFKAPLHIVKGKGSDLYQLKHTVDRDSMYRQYWYKSDLNSSMISSLKDVVLSSEYFIKILDDDIVVDIGCNDGTMLGMFETGIKIGYDPANNLQESASKNCTHFINDYFTANAYPYDQKAKLVTSIAMFYDLEDPHTFVEDVRKILHPDHGVWIIQMTDLYAMLKANALDNIVHEHLEYYSTTIVNRLLGEHGLEVFHISRNTVNGGSIRLFVAPERKRLMTSAYIRYLNQEREFLYEEENVFNKFIANSYRIRHELRQFIHKQLEVGKTVYAAGASTKGNTMLQFCGLDNTDIAAIGEVSSAKFGLRTVGTDIPIIPDQEMYANNPDYVLVLPWHFIDNIKNRNAEYLKKGGAFIIPCPMLEIHTENGVMAL